MTPVVEVLNQWIDPVRSRQLDEPLHALPLRLRSPPAFLLGLPCLAHQFGLVCCHSGLTTQNLGGDQDSDDHLGELTVELVPPLVPGSEVWANPVRPRHMQ
jgi:hypothetical protein